MHEIKCPHCQKVFQVDESGYADIATQIRNHEFDKELKEKLATEKKLLDNQKEKELSELQNELEKLKISQKNELELAKNDKDKEIDLLNTKLESLTEKKELEIQNALTEKEKQLADLKNEMENLKTSKENELEFAKIDKDKEIERLKAELEKLTEKQPLEIQNALSEKEKEVEQLNHKMETLRLDLENKMTSSRAALEKERNDLENQLILSEKERELEKQSLQKEYETQLKVKEEEIAFYKDFKAKQSTKMIGESLENYTEQEFNKLRATAFKSAYFEKDNDAKTGSKGDFIFRDYEGELEYISIMFEMKNEQDTTATKHKNRDFFKELDKDRREKNCEYAVLVSLLESENEFYNTGIVEVSEYEKMYVVRPQFFIQMISLLRNAALNSLAYKQELSEIKNREIDITNFENDLNIFRDNFMITAKNFNGNLEKLDKNLEDSIKKLTNARDELRKAMKNLGTAENKLEGLSVKRLVKNNPTMKAKFEEL
ncbi:hypothetical protein SAMN02745116_02109 [Pilibacter termitis]|uniref:DUF2130 domain-containing protein n=1 Tax=Pilibacter termitis TaxID=263852 RepID=A0A1T4Q9L0_9ENTE|nr:DUF2130 domain-containing protein [Pilibacter termitis]SKA00326.1 hypothetical protein SAMN02745116_02109 [Pilibacter termitis]